MCYHCGEKFNGDKVYRNTTCSKCGRDLRCCFNCKFYEPGSQWDCRESISEGVTDKEKANFCDFFQYIDKDAKSPSDDKAKKAKADLLKLFGGAL